MALLSESNFNSDYSSETCSFFLSLAEFSLFTVLGRADCCSFWLLVAGTLVENLLLIAIMFLILSYSLLLVSSF